MSFYDSVARAKALLREQGRLSIAGLKREFALDDAGVEQLIDELVEVQRTAVRDGKVLVWAETEARQLPAARTPPTPQARPAPSHLAEKIRQSKAALEGERKQVTVLFADVQGSMELAEGMDPEAWSRIMQRFFRILAEGVERFEGFVDKFTGDGIMAIFGAPIAHEDHARRACYAALHMRDELARYANDVRREHGVVFSTRMGLNSGEVVVGKIGDDLRMDYTAQGHTVGLAQRMETLASPDSCFITSATAGLVTGYFTLEDLGEFQIKGVAHPVRVHRLEGVGASRTRLDVSRARGFSRFVGRGDEMHVLESALGRAKTGSAQVVGIVGDAGLGKSRLCFEFLERCRAQGLQTYETTGVAHGRATPLVPMLKLFKAFFGITELDSATTARERIAGRLLLVDEGLRASLPLVFDFMGYPDPDNPPPAADAETRQRQMFNIIRRTTHARGQRETSVVLLEDLHWFDAASAAYLDPMIEAGAATRSLYVLNFRPEYQPPWIGKSFYLQLPLGPLGTEAIRELLDSVLGADLSIKGLAEAIHAKTAGNPFYTEEVVQNLIETGKLQGTKGAYRLVTPVDRLEVPGSVHALLAARIDRLAEREKDVLQTAAVIGREFDEPTLAAVVEQDAPQLREALQRLKDTEFVYDTSIYPVAEYSFKHPLTQEVALATQLQEKRRRLHGAVAAVIEAAHPNDLDQRASLIAHHWEQSGNRVQAVRWHRRAAEWMGSRDPVEGLRHWSKVRELGASLTDRDSKDARLAACSAILFSGGWRMGLTESDAQSCLDEARTLGRELERPALVALAMAGYASNPGVRGDVRSALKLYEEAVGMLSRVTSLDDRIALLTGRGHWRATAGRVDLALESIAEVEGLVEGDPQKGRARVGFSPYVWCFAMRANVLAMKGDLHEAWTNYARGMRLARSVGDREILGLTLSISATAAYLGRGISGANVSDLRPAAMEGAEIAEGFSLYSQLFAEASLGVAHYLSGDFPAAVSQLETFLQHASDARTGRDFESLQLSVLADAKLAMDDIEGAKARSRQAIEVADTRGAGFFAGLARAVLADVLVREGGSESDIVELIADAHAIARETGGRSIIPRLAETEARLKGGKDLSALKSGLREAMKMYVAMGMHDPAARIEKEIAALA